MNLGKTLIKEPHFGHSGIPITFFPEIISSTFLDSNAWSQLGNFRYLRLEDMVESQIEQTLGQASPQNPRHLWPQLKIFGHDS